MGECDANPRYMKKNCGPVCQSCEFLTIEGRCRIDDAGPEVWGPGDLNAMFERLVSEPFLSTYEVKILSSPDSNDGPWIISMENFVSETEAEKLIELGAKEGYKRSLGNGKLLPDGSIEEVVSPTRTSTNAWCQGACYNDTTARDVTNRVSDAIRIPEGNSEHIQLLRYEVGQL